MPERSRTIRQIVAAAMIWSVLLTACLAATPKVEKPTGPAPLFFPSGGVFAGSVQVAARSAIGSGVVRYTLDGSDPSEKSELFPTELKLTGTTQVRACVFEGGKVAGPVLSQTYTIIEKELETFTSNLPIVILNTFGKEILRDTKVKGSVRFIDEKNGQSTIVAEPDFDGRGDLNLRGHSSLRYLKRSFSLKTRDDAGKSRSVSILGFPEDSDWVLYAPYPDKTLLRDVLTYDLSRQMGRYASRTKFVELFLNQVGGRMSKRHYMGVYVLEEKIKRSKGRVDIAKLSPEDRTEPAISGGYIFKKDHWDDRGETEPTVEGRPNFGGGGGGSRGSYQSGPGGFPADPAGFMPATGGGRRMRREGGVPVEEQFRFQVQPPRRVDGQVRVQNFDQMPPGFNRVGEETFRTGQGNEFFYVEPKDDEITPAQKAWLQRHLNEFERVLHGPNFKDPVKGYAAYIDVDSFIDHHLIVELTKNIDGFRFSTFFHKDRGGKIKMEPIWDWNLSYGNANGKQGQIAEYWYWPQLDDQQYSYYRRLFEDPDFGQRYVDRLAELRATVFSLSNLNARIDARVADLGEARVRNFQRWPILSRRIWPNTFVGKSYEDEINYMKGFITQRMAWVDRQFIAIPQGALSAGPGNGGRTLTLSSSSPKVYVTVDGSDPRASGGQPSAKAAVYQSPMSVSAGAKVMARAWQDGRWSAPARF
jgi:hypothetical protein